MGPPAGGALAMKAPSLIVPAKYVDGLNIGLLVLTCGIAHLLPYHLLIFSYAVLGPAHYLTQISWLHDRRYFASTTLMMPVLAFLSLLAVLLMFYSGDHQATLAAAVFSVALGTALLFVVPDTFVSRALAWLTAVALIVASILSPRLALFLAIMLPTVVHVFVFTACFMWVGARKSGKPGAYAALFVLFACVATFLVPADAAAPDLHGIAYFRPVAMWMQSALGISGMTETQLFGFLSFAYTYHYFNWFSKAEVIHWNRIPPRRMQAIVAIYALAIVLYAVNFELGFIFILLLAQMHVLLEFPLNWRTFAMAVSRKRT
jgi:hypothetical protein